MELKAKTSTPSPSCLPWLIGGGGEQVITAGEKDNVFAKALVLIKITEILSLPEALEDKLWAVQVGNQC